MLEEPGSARLGLVQVVLVILIVVIVVEVPEIVGLVQLNSGSTNFNTTLNLTGPILLGLGIAAATLFYAYFNAFKGSVVKSNIGNLL